jgi:hypothetical protein
VPPRRVPSRPGRSLCVVSLVHCLSQFLSVSWCSDQSDVGTLPVARSVSGSPRLVVAEISARPALAGRAICSPMFRAPLVSRVVDPHGTDWPSWGPLLVVVPFLVRPAVAEPEVI